MYQKSQWTLDQLLTYDVEATLRVATDQAEKNFLTFY